MNSNEYSVEKILNYNDCLLEEELDYDLLPKNILYSTSARFGGIGLDLSAHQGALSSFKKGILNKVISFGNNQNDIPSDMTVSLVRNPVRILSFLPSQKYYALKKKYLDFYTSRYLEKGIFDCLHSWSGDCTYSFIKAKQMGLPCLLDIPTCHRNKGKKKAFETQKERELRLSKKFKSKLHSLSSLSRQRVIAEYELADIILVASHYSAYTFLKAGFSEKKIFYLSRGADKNFYQAKVFEKKKERKFIFVGALIKRKGVHLMIEAWSRAKLKNAKLVLVGHVHKEIEPFLEKFGGDSIVTTGKVSDVRSELMGSDVFVFPSKLEGSAKAVHEAAACGLPIISCRQVGEVVVDNFNGILIPPDNMEYIAKAFVQMNELDFDKLKIFGKNSRDLAVNKFSWEHYHKRLLHAYAQAGKRNYKKRLF